ncbi:hypothetical protein ACLB2K_041529 [Fragaria x ananassa]
MRSLTRQMPTVEVWPRILLPLGRGGHLLVQQILCLEKGVTVRELNDPLIINTVNPSHEIASDYSDVQESMLAYLGDTSDLMLMLENKEISLKYTDAHGMMERTSTTIDDIFAYSVAHDIINDDEIEPCSIKKCQRRADWPKWKDEIQYELDSPANRQVFSPVVSCLPNVKPIGHKWVFVRKRNEKHEVMRYKAQLVAQGFSQHPVIDYEETYSPVMDVITFRYLVSLVVSEKLSM